MQRFDGKVALVTGASRGIGFGIAERLVAEGARVCLTARQPEPLERAVTALGGAGHAIAVAGKAHDPAHRAEAVGRTLAAFDRLDVLVNNAGTNPVFGPLMDLEPDAARKILEVNLLAALAWVQQAHADWMADAGSGVVVNVASTAGQRPAPGIGFYGVSKAGMINLTQQLARELGPAIRVNAVAPAVVKTRFASVLYEGREEEVASAYVLRRLGAPDDVAGAVAFLASEDASWITGQTVTLDGGLALAGGI